MKTESHTIDMTAMQEQADVVRPDSSPLSETEADGASASQRPWLQRGPVRRALRSVLIWFDSSKGQATKPHDMQVDYWRSIPYIGVHLMCLGVIWVGWSPVAVGVAALLYALRMFAITGFYHRYFSHRSFKTSRFWQFMFGVAGNSAVQRGPLWWSAHHRDHHRHSDQPEDVHSPHEHGFYWSHFGWITSKSNYLTKLDVVKDLAKFPELRFLDRFETLVPITLGVSCYLLGAMLQNYAPSLGTSGMQMLIWGFFISTVVLAHGTFCINSVAHLFGNKRYKSKDESRNSLLLALITGGEGWHNNHHYYPGATRQGFYWWEVDFTYYGLKTLSWLGIIWDLNPVPLKVRESNKLVDDTAPAAGSAVQSTPPLTRQPAHKA